MMVSKLARNRIDLKTQPSSPMELIAVLTALTKRHIMKFSRQFFEKTSSHRLFCGAA
jgi:hypothetical protein